MTDAEILEMTKLNLTIIGTTWDAYLANLIEAAKKSIEREGITIDTTSLEDCNIIVMYAAYLYRRRVDAEAAMPRMLRYALNNRLFAEKASS